MNKVYLATALNFFFPGLGWLVLGRRPILGAIILVGILGLTYVEFGVQTAAPALYLPMFASVFAINTALAIECYQEGAAKVSAPSLA